MKEEDKKTAALVETIIKAIEDRKGHNIVSLDLRKIENASCKYFIICHGTSNTQVESIAKHIIDEAQDVLGEKPMSKEGFENAYWILLDYFDVVVHVFYEEAREFYSIEDLWADAEVNVINE